MTEKNDSYYFNSRPGFANARGMTESGMVGGAVEHLVERAPPVQVDSGAKESAPDDRRNNMPTTLGMGSSFSDAMQQYFGGDASTQQEIMSKVESLIHQHNVSLAQQEKEKTENTDNLPGLSVNNPLESTVIAKNGPLPQGMVPESVTTTMPGQKKKRQRARAKPQDGTRERQTSTYRGVTRHSRSGRYEAHIWVKELRRQVYLGGYEHEEHAAEAYDIAALKSKGRTTKINFDISKYEDLLDCIDRMTMDELVMAIRRQSQGFSRGTSTFRGVTRHPTGRWEARIGIPGSKHVYLGLFTEEIGAARAYDKSLVRLRGKGASTNFSLGDYREELCDFHRLQSKILQGDPRVMEITSNQKHYEAWLKHGSMAHPVLLNDDDNAAHTKSLVEEDLNMVKRMIDQNGSTPSHAWFDGNGLLAGIESNEMLTRQHHTSDPSVGPALEALKRAAQSTHHAT